MLHQVVLPVLLLLSSRNFQVIHCHCHLWLTVEEGFIHQLAVLNFRTINKLLALRLDLYLTNAKVVFQVLGFDVVAAVERANLNLLVQVSPPALDQVSSQSPCSQLVAGVVRTGHCLLVFQKRHLGKLRR